MVTISQKDVVATVTVAGIIVRYGFYLIGAITLALVAIAITTIWSWRAHTIDAKPAFRIAAPELARLSVRSKVILSWRGRVETRHYGQIYDRDMDLTVALIMPPNNRATITIDGLPDIPDIKPLRNRASSPTPSITIWKRASVRCARPMCAWIQTAAGSNA